MRHRGGEGSMTLRGSTPPVAAIGSVLNAPGEGAFRQLPLAAL